MAVSREKPDSSHEESDSTQEETDLNYDEEIVAGGNRVGSRAENRKGFSNLGGDSRFEFLNLVGVGFSGGNIAFSSDGRTLFSAAASNRVVVQNLDDLSALTLDVETRQSLAFILPAGNDFILLIDKGGRVLYVNARKEIPLNRLKLKQPASAAAVYSPSFRDGSRGSIDSDEREGTLMAVCCGNQLYVYELPTAANSWRFVRRLVVLAHSGRINSIEFSPDGKYLLTSSDDRTLRLWTIPAPHSIRGAASPAASAAIEKSPIPLAFIDHKTPVKFAGFASMTKIVSISDEGVILVYQTPDQQSRVELESSTTDGLDSTADGAKPEGWTEAGWADPNRNRARDIRPSRFRRKGEALEAERLAKTEDTDLEGSSLLRRSEGGAARMNSKSEQEGEDGRGDGVLAKGDQKNRVKSETDETTRPQSDSTDSYGEGCGRAKDGEPKMDVWTLYAKKFVDKEPHTRVKCVAFSRCRQLLAVGLTNQSFCLHDCSNTDISRTQQMSVGNIPSSLAFDPRTGDWLAIGSKTGNTLSVWEWASETFVKRQQASINGYRSVALMSSGFRDFGTHTRVRKETSAYLLGDLSRSIVAFGGFDGIVQLWDTKSGLLVHEFKEHASIVTGVAFTPQLNAVLSVSVDGTVKAYDLLRMQLFRTLTYNPAHNDEPRPQLNRLCIDQQGEIVAASSEGSDCRVFLWSIQTGALLDVLVSHEKAVTDLSFAQSVTRVGLLGSSSLDGSVCVQNIFGRAGKGGAVTRLEHTQPAVCFAFDPRDNNCIAVSYLGGQVYIWNFETEEVVGIIETLRDIHVGRRTGQLTRADKSDPNQSLHFSRIIYSVDGGLLICACKESPRVCVYSTETRGLVSTIELTRNRDIDGLLRQLNSRYVEDGVALENLDLSDSDASDNENAMERLRTSRSLPGAQFNKFAATARRRQLLVFDMCLSADGEELMVATNLGTYRYGLASRGLLGQRNRLNCLGSAQTVLLSEDTNVEEFGRALAEKRFFHALRISLSLNQSDLIFRAFSAIDLKEIAFAAKSLPSQLVPVLLAFISTQVLPTLTGQRKISNDDGGNGRDAESSARSAHEHMSSQHFESAVRWLSSLLSLADVSSSFVDRHVLLKILKELQERKDFFLSLYTKNKYTLQFLADSRVHLAPR